MNRKGTLFVVTGPSGAGKGTVLKEVTSRMDHLYFSVSATTRAPRAGEADGVHYHFLDRAGFEDLIRRDRLLEYAEYVGNYYGTPLDPVTEHLSAGDDVLLEIEVQGALKVKEKRPDAALIFIAPPSFAELAAARNRKKPSAAAWRPREESAPPWTATIILFSTIGWIPLPGSWRASSPPSAAAGKTGALS